jgi:hypothetical protein
LITKGVGILTKTQTHIERGGREREREREYSELWKPNFINIHELHHEII